MIKAIIFDFDGVICDTEHKKFNDLSKILKKNNYALKEDRFLNIIGKKTPLILAEEFPDMSENIIENIIKQRRKLQYTKIEEYKLISGLKELLLFLKSKKITLAITTGSKKEFIDKILTINSLTGYFDIIISGEDFNLSKPNPECYILTLERLHLSSSEVLVIEDSVAGIEAAKTIDCKVFAIKTYFTENELYKADKIFKDHSDILIHLKKV